MLDLLLIIAVAFALIVLSSRATTLALVLCGGFVAWAIWTKTFSAAFRYVILQ
jgi:hypothetical protein